jgi:hypothetical protein
MLSLGAINKKTGSYITASLANKQHQYKCPDCSKDVILCRGKIKAPYFRHYADSVNPCHYYDKPSESQIHKDAKMCMKFLLESKIPFELKRKCSCCKTDEAFEMPTVTDTSSIQLEHRFQYGGELKIADVAYLDNNEIVCIFEIYYKHKTDAENRPDPWFEIDAVSLLTLVNSIERKPLTINCIRSVKCDDCCNREENYVRRKLGQKEPPAYNEYGFHVSGLEHLRLDFHASTEEAVYDNKNLIELFENDMISKRAVFYSWKGSALLFIVSRNDYYKYNYWEIPHYDAYYTMPYPYLNRYDVTGWGTVDIITDILELCK